jgi:hypothetical protein
MVAHGEFLLQWSEIFGCLCRAHTQQSQAMGADADIQAYAARCGAHGIFGTDCVHRILQERPGKYWSPFNAASSSVQPQALWQWRLDLEAICSTCLEHWC